MANKQPSGSDHLAPVNSNTSQSSENSLLNSSLVTNSQLDASVSPYIPQSASMSYNSAHQYYGASASTLYHGVQYPPAMQPVYADTEDYSSDAGAIHETNTSVPPPAAVAAYDSNHYPMSYSAVQPTPQYYIPHHGHQQVLQPHMYPTQYYTPYPMANPHQEYYNHEGPGARDEAPEGPDGSASCGGDRRRSSLSVSSCSSAAAVPPGPTSPGTMDGSTPPHQGEAQHHPAVVSAAQYSLPSYHQSQKPLLHPPPSLAPQHQPTLSSMTAKHARHPAAPYGGGAAAAAAAAATCMVHVQNSHVSLSLFPPNQGGMVPYTGLVQHPNAPGHLTAGAYPSGVPTNLVPQHHVVSHQQQQQQLNAASHLQLNAANHLAYLNAGAMMDQQQQQHSAASASGYHRAQQQRHSYRNEDMNSNKQAYRGGTGAGRGRGMSRGGGVRGGTNTAVNRSRRSDSFAGNNDRNSFIGNERNSFSGGDRMNTNDDRGSYENNSFANNEHGDRDYGQPLNYVQFHQVPFNQMSKKLEGHPLFVHNVPMVPTSDPMANYVSAYQPYLNQPPPGNDMPTMITSHIPPPQTTQYSHNFNEQNCHVYNNIQNKESGLVEQNIEGSNNGVVQELLVADGNGNVSEAPPHGVNAFEPSNGNADTYSPILHNAMVHESHKDQLCVEQVFVAAPAGQNVSALSSPAPTPLQEQFSELSVSQSSASPIPSAVPASDVRLSSAAASPVPEAVSPTCGVTLSGMTMLSSLPTNEEINDVPPVSVSSSPLPPAASPQSSANSMFPESQPTAVAASSTQLAREEYTVVPNERHEFTPQDTSLGQRRIPIMDTHSRQVFNLPFQCKFGDISAEDLCMEMNKINNGDSTLKGLKNVEKKLDSTPSKSKKSPLFDTSVHDCDAITVPFTSGNNTRNSMTESPGFQFICTDVTSPAYTSLATSLVFTSRSLNKETDTIMNSGTISYPVASNLPMQSDVDSSLSSVKPASAVVKQQQTASSRREPLPVAVTCPTQVVPDHAPTSEKPPVPPKKSSVSEQVSPYATSSPSVAAVATSTSSQAAAAVHATPQQAASIPLQAATGGGSSAWQKQKNWKEHLTGEKKRIAVVSPFNGTVIGPGLSSDGGAELTSASGVGSMLQGFAGAVTNGPSAYQPPRAEAAQPQQDAALESDRTKIGEFLVDYKTDYSSVTLQPRGLTNKNYWCYSNTVLQSMVCIPQFVNLYRKMDELLEGLVTPDTLPVSHSIIGFIKEFAPMNVANINQNTRSRGKKGGQNIVNLPEIHLGDPFEPSSIHKMLLEKTGGQFMEGLQQDAEEMLTFLLNAGHDEFTECLKLASMKEANKSGKAAAVTTNAVEVLPNGQADDSNEAWVTMGPKNKSCITRTTQFSHSPISKIFWGESRSIIRKGNSPVTANLEPFITLPLDIQDDKITSVKDALEQFVSKADVAGYTCTDTREELTVSNQRLLEQLPEVLILQLKRFVYSKDGGLQKLVKDVATPIDLEITKDLISVNNRKRLCADKNKYKLVSIIYHDGKEASKGHYVCDRFHSGYNCWLHYDDACVKAIAAAELQRCNAPRVPYILFYRREDTFLDGNFPTTAPPSNALIKRRTKDKRNSSPDTAESVERSAVSGNKVSNSIQQQLPSAGVPEDESSGVDAVVSVGNDTNSLDRKGSKERKTTQNPPKTSNKRQDVKKGGQAKKNVTTKNTNSS